MEAWKSGDAFKGIEKNEVTRNMEGDLMERHFLKGSLSIILFLAIVLWGSAPQAALETTVEEIMANKDSYDEKEVSVSGTVSSPKFKSSKQGKPYMTFPLLGNSEVRINVLLWGDMKLRPGKKISVRGVYRKNMKVGNYPFLDMIEATEIKTDDKK
jgi:hypothetical protein